MNCPQCAQPTREDLLAKMGGICPPCLAGFALEGADDAEPLPLPPGTTFRGYAIGDLIGRGGMAFVYRARQPGLDRQVAIKVLTPVLSADPEFVARFRAEARALASLSHPNVVTVHEVGEEDGLFFFVMEHVDGVSLRRVMCERRLAPEESLRVVTEVCAALEYAHARGVIHRDVKPENILLDRGGRVKIADFGLAKLVGRRAADQPVTRTSHVLGTPQYMAPEQFDGTSDARTDIYALGVVLYELLTGEIPRGKFEPPSQRVPVVDPRLDAVVMRALERDPARRFQTATDMRRQMAGGRPVPPVRPWLALAASVAVVVAAVYVAWPSRRTPPPVEPTTTSPPTPPPAPPERPWTAVTEFELEDADGILTVKEGEIVAGAYRDAGVRARTRTPLPESCRLRFRLRYEVDEGDEPWIIAELGERWIFLFPEGGHEVALAERGERGAVLLDKTKLPDGKPARERWSEFEVRIANGRFGVVLDGARVFDGPSTGMAGPLSFALGGAAREVRIAGVAVRRDE